MRLETSSIKLYRRFIIIDVFQTNQGQSIITMFLFTRNNSSCVVLNPVEITINDILNGAVY